MQTATFPPLEQITRDTLTTEEAAYYLNRKPQTLRSWASTQPSGVPLLPIRIYGRLAWPTKGVRAALSGERHA